MLRSCALFLCLIIILAVPAVARDLTPDERSADFEQLVSLIRSTYGMLEYKKQAIGLDFEALSARYRAGLKNLASDNEFYDLLSAFTTELKDAHVGHYRPSNRFARLGFTVARADGKAIIAGINRKVLAADTFPFQVGDELVAIGGETVERMLKKILPQHSGGNDASSLGLATRMLTSRWGGMGPVPTGVVKVDVRPRGSEEGQSVNIPWIVHGEALPGLSFHGQASTGLFGPKRPTTEMSVQPVAARMDPPTASIYTPDGARTIAAEEFEAAVFDSPKGPMGYIRIPSFMPGDTQKAIQEMRKLLKEMWYTKGLVLDLNNNPGGSLYYGYALAAMFVNRPLEMPTIAQRASRSNLSMYLAWIDEVQDPVTRQLLQYSADQLRAALEKDQPMTDFGFAYGISAVVPDPEVVYTKPILMLINDQCYSCGDIFPALLQDNKRAKLFGHTTAGAGGAVTEFGPLAYSGSKVSLTLNVFKRSSGTYIENVGVTPEIEYDVTQDDIATNYRAYKAAYIAELMKLVE